FIFFFSSRRRHTRFSRDWSSDVCSSDLFKVWVNASYSCAILVFTAEISSETSWPYTARSCSAYLNFIANSAFLILKLGIRRKFLANPSLEQVQINHLVGSYCHHFTPLR